MDVFFVISGYLITRIISKDIEAGQFTLSAFWKRRVRRIVPALAFMLIAATITIWILGPPTLGREAAKHAIYALVGIGNYRSNMLVSNYWTGNSEEVPFLHTWSLGVEEQFYLIYPLFFLVLWRRGRRQVSIGIAAVILISVVVCAIWTNNHAPEAFFITIPRAWELGAGALLALWSSSKVIDSKWSESFSWVGLILISACYIIPVPTRLFPWPMAAIPVLGACIFIHFSSQARYFRSLLSKEPLIWVGKASYSLYLWHWPMLVLGLFLSMGLEQAWLRPAGLLLGVSLGAASYCLVEKMGIETARPLRLASVLSIAAAATSFSLVGVANQANLRVESASAVEAYDAKVRGELGGLRIGKVSDSTPDVILLGDSHALPIAAALDVRLKVLSRSGYVHASGGVRLVNWNPTKWDLVPSERKLYDDRRDELLIRAQPAAIFLSARWETYMSPDGMTAVKKFFESLRASCPRSAIVIIAQPPRLDYPDISHAEWIAWRGVWGISETTVKKAPDSQAEAANLFLRNYCLGAPNTIFVSSDKLFAAQSGRAATFMGHQSLYQDDDHLSVFGAQQVLEDVLSLPELKLIFNSPK